MDSERSKVFACYTEFSIYRERAKKIQIGGPPESSAERNQRIALTEMLQQYRKLCGVQLLW